MTSLPAPDNRLYLGKGGSGKTTLALAHASVFSRVLWFDPNGELTASQLHGAVLCSDRAYLLDLMAAPGTMRIIWRGVVTGGGEAFEFANRAAWASEDWCVVWDEVDRFTSASVMPPYARQIVDAGRHRRLRLFAISRRPASIPRRLSANTQRIAIYRTTEPADLRWYQRLIGDAAKRIPGIPQYHAMDWREGHENHEIRACPFR